MEQLCFFFDIDGTLCDGENNMPASTKVAITKLQQQGHITAIATGRSYQGSKEIAELLDIKYRICDGGNSVYINDTCVSINGLEEELIDSLIKYCNEQSIPYILIDNEHYYHETPLHQMEITHPWIKYGGTQTQGAPIMKVGMLVSEEEKKEIQAHFNYNFCSFKGCNLFVTDQDNKHLGISKCIEIMGYMGKQIVFGDSMNDIKMFDNADFAVCMGQAKEAVKQKADYVTTSMEEDGIYHACVSLGYFEVDYEEGKDQ